MADRRSANVPPDIFSDAESDVEEFVGFDARDTRPYAEIASLAPLFTSTPIPKAKRVCIDTLIDSDDSLNSSNLNDDQGSTSVEHLPCNRISSSSSVEGEVAPGIFEANSHKNGAAIFQASSFKRNEQSSPSSLEGEIFSDVTDEPKEGLPAVSPDNSERIGQESTSTTLQQTKEAETQKPGTRRRGKTTSIAMHVLAI